MIRNPSFDTRRTSHSAAYWYEELVRMRDLYEREVSLLFPEIDWKESVKEYGGLHALRTDIELLRSDLNNGEIK